MIETILDVSGPPDALPQQNATKLIPLTLASGKLFPAYAGMVLRVRACPSVYQPLPFG